MSQSDSSEEATHAVVLDFLAHGRTDDSSPQYQRSPVAYAVGPESFRLFEIAFEDNPDVTIGDKIIVEPAEKRVGIEAIRQVEYEDLSSGAKSELDYVIEEIVEAQEDRFVEFYNTAQPITLRLHQLNLLPGIGKKLRNGILDERKRKPFDDFDEIEERVSGLHDPKGVIVERITEELQEDDLKYQIFVGRDEE